MNENPFSNMRRGKAVARDEARYSIRHRSPRMQEIRRRSMSRSLSHRKRAVLEPPSWTESLLKRAKNAIPVVIRWSLVTILISWFALLVWSCIPYGTYESVCSISLLKYSPFCDFGFEPAAPSAHPGLANVIQLNEGLAKMSIDAQNDNNFPSTILRAGTNAEEALKWLSDTGASSQASLRDFNTEAKDKLMTARLDIYHSLDAIRKMAFHAATIHSWTLEELSPIGADLDSITAPLRLFGILYNTAEQDVEAVFSFHWTHLLAMLDDTIKAVHVASMSLGKLQALHRDVRPLQIGDAAQVHLPELIAMPRRPLWKRALGIGQTYAQDVEESIHQARLKYNKTSKSQQALRDFDALLVEIASKTHSAHEDLVTIRQYVVQATDDDGVRRSGTFGRPRKWKATPKTLEMTIKAVEGGMEFLDEQKGRTKEAQSNGWKV